MHLWLNLNRHRGHLNISLITTSVPRNWDLLQQLQNNLKTMLKLNMESLHGILLKKKTNFLFDTYSTSFLCISFRAETSVRWAWCFCPTKAKHLVNLWRALKYTSLETCNKHTTLSNILKCTILTKKHHENKLSHTWVTISGGTHSSRSSVLGKCSSVTPPSRLVTTTTLGITPTRSGSTTKAFCFLSFMVGGEGSSAG